MKGHNTMLEKIHDWIIKIVVGKKPIIMNVVINGAGIKEGFAFLSNDPAVSVIGMLED
jgi:hypothetical protein